MTIPFSFRLVILFAIIATQVVSSVLIVPGAESFGGSVFRIILVVATLMLIATTGFERITHDIRRALIVGVALSAWMAISVLWSSNMMSGLREVSYIVTIVMLIYVLSSLIQTPKEFSTVCIITFLIGVIVLVLSYQEMVTGIHYFRAAIEDIAEESLRSSSLEEQAWFTFGNPNDLSVHLAFCAFFVIFFVKDLKTLLLGALFTACVIYMCNELDARIVIISFIAYVVVCISGYARSRSADASKASKWIVIGSYSVLALAAMYSYRAEFLDVSTFVRLQLIVSAFKMGVSTIFIGAGAGDFENTMLFSGLVSTTYGIVNPHSAIARMFAENGLLGLVLLAYMIFGPIGVVRRAGRISPYSCYVAASCAALPFLLSSGSDPISASSLQFAIALSWVGCRFAFASGVESGNR